MLRVMPRAKETVQRVAVAKVVGENLEGEKAQQSAQPRPMVRPAPSAQARPMPTNAQAPNGLTRQAMPGTASTQKPVKVGRNDPCPCGSGTKYKKCCGSVDAANDEE